MMVGSHMLKNGLFYYNLELVSKARVPLSGQCREAEKKISVRNHDEIQELKITSNLRNRIKPLMFGSLFDS